MGQAKQRKHESVILFKHLGLIGKAARLGQVEPTDSAQWLQANFVAGLDSAVDKGAHAFLNQVYLKALQHVDPDISAGIRVVMNRVYTAGLEPGRVVFGLICDMALPRPEVLSEFDSYGTLEAWVCAKLGVAAHNLRLRHSVMIAPAHAGLFTLVPNLQLVTQRRIPGAIPHARTRKVSDELLTRQTILIWASVFMPSDTPGLELNNINFSLDKPTFELPYWGVDADHADSKAQVTVYRAEPAFDALEHVTFRKALLNAKTLLDPWRPAGEKPVLEVRIGNFEEQRGPQFSKRRALWARFQGTDMPELAIYFSSFAEYLLPHLPSLGLTLLRLDTPDI